MKKSFTILILSIIIYFFPVWNGTFAQEPLDFMAFGNNPVLTHGNPGSYDATMCIIPYALWHDQIFYLYYTGDEGICLATSPDGYNYTKFTGNPLLIPSASGFDSYGVSQGVVLEVGSKWVMYYNGRDAAGYGPGKYVGRATSDSLTGVWERSANPVLTVGGTGEWDEGFITPNMVIPMDMGGYIMFYSASSDFFTGYWEIGMATSQDGITWTKYNDPSTTFPPYNDSDPVLKVGASGEWDEGAAWECTVIFKHGYYEMYYSGAVPTANAIGYAWSDDGITWEKWPENPIYITQDDPYAVNTNSPIEVPSLLIYNETVFMYYDYGTAENSIGVATADVWVGKEDKEITNYELRITNYPNPVSQSTTFSYTLKEPGHVTIQVFNSFGQLVAEPLNAQQTKGEQKVTWDAENLPSGIYFYRIQAGKEAGGGKMIKL